MQGCPYCLQLDCDVFQEREQLGWVIGQSGLVGILCCMTHLIKDRDALIAGGVCHGYPARYKPMALLPWHRQYGTDLTAATGF